VHYKKYHSLAGFITFSLPSVFGWVASENEPDKRNSGICKLADTGEHSKIISPDFFHDLTAYYHLHVLRRTHIKNQVIWSSFTH